jgi:amino acid adenylation domain-containing protein
MARQTPHAPAIEGPRGRVRYGELDRSSSHVAALLVSMGIHKGDLVGIFTHDRQFMIECVLGILKAGAAFVPLSPRIPADRLDSMLVECIPKWAIVTDDLRERFSSLPVSRSIRTLSLSPEINSDAETDFVPVERDGDDLSYIFFTSGSTGKPKGIAGRLKGVDHFIRWQQETCRLGPESRVSQLMSPMFDAFLRDMFAPLCSGGTVCIPPDHDILLDGAKLARWLDEQRITLTHMVPSVFRLMIGHCEQATRLQHLQYVLLAGEPLLPADVKAWYEVVGKQGGRLINMYGTSETTMAKFAYMVQEEDQFRSSIPAGKPIKGTKALVLDEEGRVCPPGLVGEIYIRTPYRSLGYYQRPDLTQEVFVPNPFGKDPLDVVHKTGDLGRVLEDGNFEVIGRRDNQIKIRGQRVELGEIEAALSECPGVAQATVIAREIGNGEKRLVAWLVPRSGTQLDPNELRALLKKRLMEYMVPTQWGLLETLPLTSNGKVDREALQQMEPKLGRWTRGSREARNPAEDMLCGIWEEVLNVRPIGVQDNFFELGGHSLLATQVISRIQAVFSVELPIQAVFEAPTVLAMSQRIEQMKQSGAVLKIPPIRRVKREGAAPLSYAQQRLWFIDQLDPDQATYNIPAAVRITGRLDVQALQKSLAEVVNRHESLRTHFHAVGGQPQQIIEANVAMELQSFDLSVLGPQERETEAQRLAYEEAHTPFDLQHAPLLRIRLLKLAAEDHVLAMTMHHIVSDAWSVSILIREISELYRASIAGRPSPLPELPIQYSDYSIWQREWLKDDVLTQQLDYWKKQLAGAIPLELPSDHPRPAARTYRGATVPFSIPLHLTEKLKELSRKNGATVYMSLLAIFQTLFSRYSGQHDISVGTPIAGRRQPETEGLIGFFINTLVMRSDLSGDPDFLALLQRVKRVTLEAFAHQDLPFEKLVEALQPDRHLSRAPLFQVAFAVQNVPPSALDFGEAKLAPVAVDSGTAKFDLWMPLVETPKGLQGVIQYSTDLFEAGTINRMIGHIHHLLAAAMSSPGPISTLSLLSAAERRQLLEEFRPGEHHQCLHQLFAYHARRTPEAVAVVWRGRELRYAELDAQSNRLARYLQMQGVQSETCIGIAIERSPEMIIAQLGVLKSGAAYVMLDLAHPPARLAYMIKDAKMKFLLTKSNFKEQFAQYDPRILCLDSDWDAVAAQDDTPVESLTVPENLAFVIYTSGSSGTPKGSMITHRAVAGMILHSDTVRLQSTDRVAQINNASFDVSTFDIYGALLNGACMVIFDKETVLGPGDLARGFVDEGITAVFIATPVFNQLAATDPNCFSAFRYVVFGGEAADVQAVRRVLQGTPPQNLLNGYGPTETTTYVTSFRVSSLPPGAHNVPIGKPISTAEVLVLDNSMELAPVNVFGELYIGGSALARGYINRPDLTAERFVPHPYSAKAGERLYRTGDHVRWLADGNLEYRGRIDSQVKIRGYRIELGEIEVALNEQPGVRQAAVAVREDQPGVKRIVAYIMGGEDTKIEELREALKRRLPDYMVPSAFVLLEALPLTPHGKLDHKALPAPDRGPGQAYVAPRNKTEESMAKIWAEVLGLPQVGVEDNFFELGGHSLLATQVISRAQDVFQTNLPVRRLFETPTISGLAKLIEGLSETQTTGNAPPPVLPVIRRLNRAAATTSGTQD